MHAKHSSIVDGYFWESGAYSLCALDWNALYIVLGSLDFLGSFCFWGRLADTDGLSFLALKNKSAIHEMIISSRTRLSDHGNNDFSSVLLGEYLSKDCFLFSPGTHDNECKKTEQPYRCLLSLK